MCEFLFINILIGISLLFNPYKGNKDVSIFSFTSNQGVVSIELDSIKNELICKIDIDCNHIQITDNLKDSIVIFEYSYYLRGGGAQNAGLDLNYFNFNQNNFQYSIFEEYSAEDNTNTVGLKIVDETTHAETIILGNLTTVKGSLIDFRTNGLIPVTE